MLRDFPRTSHRAACALAVAIAIGVAPLAACGIKGPLKLPPSAAPATAAPSAGQPAAPAADQPPAPDARPAEPRP